MEVIVLIVFVISLIGLHFLKNVIQSKWIKLLLPCTLFLLVWFEPSELKTWKVIITIVCIVSVLNQFKNRLTTLTNKK